MKSKALQGEDGLQDLKMALVQLHLNEDTSDQDQQGFIFPSTVLFVD